MGTKNNPGQFDCHAAAEPDEPMFTLLARDKYAALLVRLWAALRATDVHPGDREEADKIEEAVKCSTDMHNYHQTHRIGSIDINQFALIKFEGNNIILSSAAVVKTIPIKDPKTIKTLNNAEE